MKIKINEDFINIELLEAQKLNNKGDVALIRVEQLYPTPVDQMEAVYKKYKNFLWTSPQNKGETYWKKIPLNPPINADLLSDPNTQDVFQKFPLQYPS